MLRLLDVSPSGDVLYDDVQIRCDTGRGHHRLMAHSPGLRHADAHLAPG